MCEDTSVTGSQQDVAVQHVVILIHGIRSLGRWHQSVDDVMGSENVRVIMPKYGWFSALRFMAPWDAGNKPMERVYKEFENAPMFRFRESFSVVP